MKKYIILSALIGLFFFFLTLAPSMVHAWFGAGSTPGWSPTTTGLRGEIALPQYKFSPDFYTVGDTVTIHTTGFNLHPALVTSHYWFVISRVIQAPIGTDRTSGDPSNPGLNENQLYDFHHASNDVQSPEATIDLGSVTFPASGSATFGGSYTTNKTGYFQFDFMDTNEFSSGHILTAGFFRVLAAKTTPTPTPTAPPGKITPTPTPTPTPTTTPGSGSGGGSNSSSAGGGIGGASQCGAQKPPTPTLTSVVRTSGTTAQLTWTAVNPVTYYMISYGTSPGSYQFGVPNTGNTTSYSIGGLNPNATYYFVVRAVNDCMPGDPSNEKPTGGQVLGATAGQVLGANTLAATGGTGILRLRILLSMLVSGVALMIFSRVKSENEKT